MPENEVTIVEFDAAVATDTEPGRAEVLRATVRLAVTVCDTEPPATTGTEPDCAEVLRAPVGLAVTDVTVTVALAVAVPPGPVQLTESVVVAGGATEAEPEIALPVLMPVPTQETASVLLHVSVEDCPRVMLVGLAEREAVGEDTAPIVNESITSPRLQVTSLTPPPAGPQMNWPTMPVEPKVSLMTPWRM
jgi:hypothetical protein